MTLETANRLYELRKKHNLSQEELAEKLGVSRQAVSKWERSEASPDTDNIIALAKIYGLTLDELIYGEKEEKNEEAKKEQEDNPDDDSPKNVFINVDDGDSKVRIAHDGIIVEEKDGSTVKISLGEKIMDKVFQKIEDEMDDCDDDEDDDDDEFYETVYLNETEIKNGGKVHIKITRPTKFWLEVPYAVICALLYLVFGFYNICGGWELSWVIFITVPVYYSLVEAIYKRKFSEFSYAVLCAFIYLICGLYFNNWHPSWLVFVTIPVYYPIAAALDKVIGSKKNIN